MYLRFANYWQTMHKAITKQNKVFASFHLCAVIIFVFCTLSVFSNSYYISHSQNLFHYFLCPRPAVLLCLWHCSLTDYGVWYEAFSFGMLISLPYTILLCNGAAEYVHYSCYWTLHFLLTLKVRVIVYYKLCAIFGPFGGVLHI